MTEEKHALLSPSGSSKWLACAGSLALEKDFPDSSNDYSDEGTCAHAVAAMCLTDNKPATAYIGRRIDVAKHRTYEFSADMAEPTQDYVDMVLARLEMHRLAGATDVELHVEQRVPIGQITGEEGAEGTADAVIVAIYPDGKVLVDVIDLKFGQGVAVFATENSQLMLYALGVLHKFEFAYDLSEAHVHLVISMPRKYSEPSEWDVSMADLRQFEQKAKERAFHAIQVYNNEKPEAIIHHLTAGDHCRKSFCKARATCPKLARFVQDTIGQDFDVMVDMVEREVVTSVDPALCSIDLGMVMQAGPIIEDWLRAVRAEVERRLLAGTAVPGYKLVQGKQGNRAFSDSAAAEVMLKSFRLKQDQMYSFKLISPTDAEKLAPKYSKDGKLKPDQPTTPIGDKQWKKLQALITRSEGGKSVAPESDPRPALTITPVIEDFEVVEDSAEDLA